MPKDYEELIRVIHERYEDMNRSYQRIAVYLGEELSFSIGDLFGRCLIHPPPRPRVRSDECFGGVGLQEFT